MFDSKPWRDRRNRRAFGRERERARKANLGDRLFGRIFARNKTEEDKSARAGWEQGLKENKRPYFQSDRPAGDRKAAKGADDRRSQPTFRAEPTAKPDRGEPVVTQYGSAYVTRRASSRLPVILYTIVLVLAYCTGYFFVFTIGTLRHDVDTRFRLMTIGPFFWVALAYPFTEKRRYKFLKLWTIFVILFAIAMYFVITRRTP